ncbi:hypothetical protein B2J88_36740 [Rhodococcus sp. SRB_17]|nr:hypothetical protein [Rhodococcus sp. SRB_17]
MFKRTFLAAAVGAALLIGPVVSANAIELTAGNYKITFDNYDSGTLGYGDTAGVKCTTVAGCNAAAARPAPGTTSDTAGILSIAAIENLSTGQTEYVRGTSSTLGGITFGPYLTGVFGGLNDYFVEVGTLGGSPTTLANSVGGFFRIYSNATDYNPTLGPTGAGVSLDAGTYPGITGGSLLLGGVFAGGAVIAGDSTTSYTSLFNNASVAGNGQGFLDFTSGSALGFFDTNSLTNRNGGTNDAFLTVAYDDVNGVASSLGWTVKSVAQVTGQIPEPGSIALLSMALFGLGAVTRRRNKQG